jgi:hypothetical protein
MTEISSACPIHVALTISRKAEVCAGGRILHWACTYWLLKPALSE